MQVPQLTISMVSDYNIEKLSQERLVQKMFHFNEWLFYFYFYCFFGWIFESVYVSLKQRQWINRGFMKGPWLPLYGSGAVLILLITGPFTEYPLAVAFVGMIAATLLEYVTGVAMVKIFHVRYWDYSNQKIQFQGHICLTSSVAWGALSMLMVYVIHQPIAEMIGRINIELLSMLSFLTTVLMMFDFTYSFRNAMDLRELLIQTEKIRQHLDSVLDEKLEKLRTDMEKYSKRLLLSNPGSLFHNLEEDTAEIKRRLREKIQLQKKKKEDNNYVDKSAD